MSEPSSPTQNLLPGAPAQSSSLNYELSDDLARLCLPREWKDSCRTLAWVNSVCFLFLVVGLVGLKPPKVIHRPLKEVAEATPVIFTPPEEVPKNEPDVKPDEPDQPKDAPDVPQVVTIVAAADPSSTVFPVPVQGAVAIASAAQLPTAPPRETHAAPTKPTLFVPGSETGAVTPKPEYPQMAVRRQLQGTVMLEIRLDASGAISSVTIQKSSGSTLLDDAALDTVRRRWHFPPGHPGWLISPIIFKLE